MNQCELAIKIAKNNNGIITSRLADENNIKRQVLIYLVNKGKLLKSDTGVYILPSTLDDEYFNIQSRYKRGVFSSLSALYLLHLTDVIPNQMYLTFPTGYNSTGPSNEGIHCIKSNDYDIGIDIVATAMNNKVRCYNPERTLCDILRKKKEIDVRVIIDAFKIYCRSNYKNIPLLMEYASFFHLEEQIRNILEILL